MGGGGYVLTPRNSITIPSLATGRPSGHEKSSRDPYREREPVTRLAESKFRVPDQKLLYDSRINFYT